MTADRVLDFYESLADSYHLLFDDWDRAIERQSRVMATLLASETGQVPLSILDCACGIETQTLGLAKVGHRVLASDLSPAAVARAREEAQRRELAVTFHIADMTDLQQTPEVDFDVVLAMDNALPHLSEAQLAQAATSIASKLKPGGLMLASIRDYDVLLAERPAIQPPAFFGRAGQTRIVHQVWDWIDERNYTVHQYITTEVASERSALASGWKTLHFASHYRGLRRAELSAILGAAGFRDIRWLMPEETGFYQPVVVARRVT